MGIADAVDRFQRKHPILGFPLAVVYKFFDDQAGYLVALAGRLVREVGAMARRADAHGKTLPTLTIDTQIGFRSAADRAAFADELTAAVLDLAARYHHDDGRPHRLLVAAHPLPEENP